MDLREEALRLHRKNKGKIEVVSKIPVESETDLSLAYTPYVAEPCKEISRNKELVYEYTVKERIVAVVTDGSAVLGLGNIGPYAALPVMEGKAVLFKEFGGIDAIPICLATQDVDEIIKTVFNIAPAFGGINLEDISAPRCFEIEKRLDEMLDIPVFHDDQHGTAIVTFAALVNALKIVKKFLTEIVVVVNGAGAAGIAISKFLIDSGVKDVIVCDRSGIIYEGREGLDPSKQEIAKITNKKKVKGTLKEALEGADVFIGVSGPNLLTKEMIRRMNKKPIVFALANPVPEIYPDEAKEAGAYVVGTGRSDFPNQVNNVLAFPGVFKGALRVRATTINKSMKLKAAYAIANTVLEDELSCDYILPKPFDKRVVENVAEAVAKEAVSTGVSKINRFD
ncbi:NAD(P)-dependent malic enzyme [Caldanaerobacter sp.]|uniref:NAD(P)-dependent malic enzyme n=1 Tax=Caldanaerobacter sp. TaxID=2930036 RepID=UPI003C75819C